MESADLIGRRCKGLVAREFWRSGRMVDEFCAVFLEDDHGDAWKFYLDDEECSWKFEQVREVPAAGMTEGDTEFNYPATDLLTRFPIRDRVIQSLSKEDLGTFARIAIGLSGGQALVLDFEYATETTTVTVKRAG